MLYLIMSVLAVPLAFPAFSQKAIEQSNDISTELAIKATNVALQSCKNKQLQCIVTVVDSKGLLKSQIVMDGAFPHAIETSMKKGTHRRIP